MSAAGGNTVSPIPTEDERLWPPRRLLYPVDEAAILIGLSSKAVWRLIYADKLTTKWNGGRRLVPAAEIDAYVANLPTDKPALQVVAA